VPPIRPLNVIFQRWRVPLGVAWGATHRPSVCMRDRNTLYPQAPAPKRLFGDGKVPLDDETVPSEWEESLKPSLCPVAIEVILVQDVGISFRWFHRHGDKAAPIPNAFTIQPFN
jgi:hypothetical protein